MSVFDTFESAEEFSYGLNLQHTHAGQDLNTCVFTYLVTFKKPGQRLPGSVLFFLPAWVKIRVRGPMFSM